MNRCIVLLCISNLAISSSVSRNDYGEVKLFQSPVFYNVDATVLLNDASRRDKEVSYKVKAGLNVYPVWRDTEIELLLKFELESPQLHARGKHISAEYMPIKSIWDSYSTTTFYAHWKHGIIEAAYLDPDELLDIQNFKRSIISLFQFQVVDGEDNETDVSGSCKVIYETGSMQVIRKYKSNCKSSHWALNEEDDNEVTSRRIIRYSLNKELNAIDEIYAEEMHTLGTSDSGAGLKARSWLRLQKSLPNPKGNPQAASLEAALADVPPLKAVPLASAPPGDLQSLQNPQSTPEEIQAAINEVLSVGGSAAGEGGAPLAARAALRLTTVLRRATSASIGALLHDRADPEALSQICYALGLSGSKVAHAAASRFLRLRHGDVAASLAHTYLSAFALAPAPQDTVIEDVMRLGLEVGDVGLGENALLAAAAAASRIPTVGKTVRDALAASLTKCKDDVCRRVRLHALGNIRRSDTAELLLDHATTGSPEIALAALDALETASLTLSPRRLRRLERLALDPRPLEVQAAALDLLLRHTVETPFSLVHTLLAIQDQGSCELRRIMWQRLKSLAEDNKPVRDLIGMLPLRLKGWDAQAIAGTSSVLERNAGSMQGWRARLESVQVARNGLLRRGAVRLWGIQPDNSTYDALKVEIWTRGLESFAGNSKESDSDNEVDSKQSTGGGLALTVGGVKLPGVTLFSSQAELLGHVWAGTGSSPTPALRAALPLGTVRIALPLLGGAPLFYAHDTIMALAMDAQAQVSLWSRNARSQLQLRGALWGEASVQVPSAWSTLTATSSAAADPTLEVASDLDFYDGVTLCVRVQTSNFTQGYNVSLSSSMGSRWVKRSRQQSWRRPGTTLALGPPNDGICRARGAE